MTRYGETQCIVSGETPNGSVAKPRLFLFHAMGLNATVWAPNAESLSKRFVVYAFDTIGDQGRSPVRFDYPRNAREYADWVADLVAGTGGAAAYMVGNSMGGWIANAAALYRPDTVKAVALISPAAGIPKRMKWGSMILSMVFDQSEKNLRKISADLLGPYGAGRDWADYMTHAPKESASAKLGMPSLFTDDELRSVSVPILLMVGDGERIYADIGEVFARAKSLIPKVICKKIPSAGHVGGYDNPEYSDEELIGFFLGNTVDAESSQ